MTDAQLRRMRRHREEMQFAIAEGLSLGEARERLRSYRSNLKRLAGEAAAAPAPAVPAPPPAERPQLWWQRD